jgi:hypothetical protein
MPRRVGAVPIDAIENASGAKPSASPSRSIVSLKEVGVSFMATV